MSVELQEYSVFLQKIYGAKLVRGTIDSETSFELLSVECRETKGMTGRVRRTRNERIVLSS